MKPNDTPLTPLEGTRIRRYGLGLVVMFLGGSGLVYEYCISTLATHLLGNSVEQFSVIIAIMLFAMGLAGLAQRNLTNDAALPGIFVVVELLLALVGGTSAVVLYLGFAWLDHFHLLLYFLAFFIGFGIGLEIPLLLRINERWRTQLSDNVGEILSLDYVGALIGALVWAFVMLPVMPLDQISLVLGLANLGAALLTWYLLKPAIQSHLKLLFLFIAVTVVLVTVSLNAPSWKDSARQRLFAYPIQHSQHSPYQSLVVTGTGARMSFYLNGRLQFDSEDEFIYHEMLVHPAMSAADRVKRVLVLGGGDGLAVREILRWPSVEHVLLVDLDPAVTRLAQTYEPLLRLNQASLLNDKVHRKRAAMRKGSLQTIVKEGEKPMDALHGHQEKIAEVYVQNADADLFLRDATGQWDVIICDFPDPSTPDLAKLYSAEFYAALKRHLAPGGVVSVQSGSPYTSRHSFWAIKQTLASVGFKVTPLHAHVPTFGEWGWHIGSLDDAPRFTKSYPTSLRYVDPPTVSASMHFPNPIAEPDGQPHISTRIDPWIMRLYERGEPLPGPQYFPGYAER
ncbi:MAG: polyamine aminopropyltransferase [Myxococcota bacterium]|nr:polyamine aminopropyltransferase [Myxococcota bacterium]